MIYGATRSTGQIEEGGGKPGYSIVTVHGGVPSWRFKETGGDWPFVQIVAPADLRMVTRSADPKQIPRPGDIEIVAKLFGSSAEALTVSTDCGPAKSMLPVHDTALWTATATLEAGLHLATVSCGNDRDTIKILVRAEDEIPRRGVPVSPGRDIHALGAWPEHGIEGTQLGPNKNGRRW